MIRPPSRVTVIQVILNLRIRPSSNQQLHHGKVAVLRSQMQRRYALAVTRAPESRLLVHGGAMIDEPRRRLQVVAHCGPDERGAAIRIRVKARARADQLREYIRPATLRSPHKRLVQHLLRIG